MNLSNLEEELDIIINNTVFEANFGRWLNNAVLEIANDFELPDLRLKRPVEFNVLETEWLYILPTLNDDWVLDRSYVVGGRVDSGEDVCVCILAHTATADDEPGTGVNWETYWRLEIGGTSGYQKKVFKCRDSAGAKVIIHTNFDYIDQLDYDHSETGDHVLRLGVEGNSFAVYPMAEESIYLWFYRKPVPMVEVYDIPDGVPEEFHRRVILPKVVLQNFEIIENIAEGTLSQSLAYWSGKYHEGLYGSSGGDLGMIHSIAKSKPPRKHGGYQSIGGNRRRGWS